MTTSIFPVNDIDEVFIHLLPLDDLLTFAQINRYYNKASNMDILMEEYKVYLTNREYYYTKFTNICINNLFNLTKWWKYKFTPSLRITYEAFMVSCLRGNLEMAKLLFSLDEINIYTVHASMKWSCETGYLDVAKWLYFIIHKNGYSIHDIIYNANNYPKYIQEWLDTIK